VIAISSQASAVKHRRQLPFPAATAGSQKPLGALLSIQVASCCRRQVDRKVGEVQLRGDIMRPNPLRARLQKGEPVFGPFIMEFASPGLPCILTNAGADFIVYDQEAGCLDIATIKNQIALTRGLGIVPLVNVPSHDYHSLGRPLDCGAMGLVVPVVQSRQEAESLTRAARYQPAGIRSVAFGIAHDDYDNTDIGNSMAAGNERTLIAAKIETAAGVDHIEQIVSVPGIDIAFVGHMDLSVSLGVPGQYEHPRFRQAVDRVIEACKAHGKTGGCLVATPDAARQWIDKGYRFIGFGTDVQLLASAFRDAISVIKAPAGPSRTASMP
jgi:2-keto-3-deoxy-L-rhamnonate aldolase RhmA